MRAGTYVLSGHDGPYAVERFTVDGSSYRATRHDPASDVLVGRLEVDLGPEVRVHAEAAGWVLRGGTVGPEVLWRRGEQEQEAVADGFTGTSPAYALAVVGRLRSSLAVGASTRLRLVAVTEPVLATRLVDEQWTRVDAERWQAVDLATGEGRDLLLADGLVVAGTGLTLTRA